MDCGACGGALYQLPSIGAHPFLIAGSQEPDTEVLDPYHRRLGDTLNMVIREAVRNKLLEGIALDRKYLNAKNATAILVIFTISKIPCPTVRDCLVGMSACSYMSADVFIIQKNVNMPHCVKLMKRYHDLRQSPRTGTFTYMTLWYLLG